MTRRRRTWSLPVFALMLAGGCRDAPKIAAGPPGGSSAAMGPSTASAATKVAPPFDDACTSDADCGLGDFGPDCCAECRFFRGSKTWIERMERFCRGDGFNPNCPVNDCPIQMADPKCVAGHCQLVMR